MIMKKFIAAICCLLALSQVFSQDPQFSQFYAAQLYLGPSFAGMTQGSRAIVNYRNQWTALPNSFKTYSLSIDHNFMSIRSGAGLIVLRDDIGTGHLTFTGIGACYSYRVRINRDWTYRPGLTFWYMKRGIDFFRLLFPDQVGTGGGTIEAPPEKNRGYIDFSHSSVVYNRKMWLGYTVDHLMRPNQSLSNDVERIPFKYALYGGAKFPIRAPIGMVHSPDESITTAFLYKQQGDWKQFDAGLYWNRMPLIFGVWWRGIPLIGNHSTTDALIFLCGFRYEDLTIAYSYDATVSRLGITTGGSHEVSITYLFNTKLQVRKRRAALPCPSF